MEMKLPEKREREERNCVSIRIRLLLLGSLFRALRNLATLAVSLLNRLDDTDGNSLPHVTDGETTKWWVLVVALHTHWLARDELDNGSVTRLDKLGCGFHGLASSAINLFNELGELAGNVGGVAVQDWGVTSANLTRVVQTMT
jgi:hypothetical protein